MKKLVMRVLIFLFFSYATIYAQPIIEWQSTLGGNQIDGESIIIEIPNGGGYLVGGTSESNISGEKTENSRGVWDIWILKLDSQGIIQWQRTIGGNNVDHLSSVSNTSDGGFILGCSSSSNISGEKTEDSKGLTDYWIIKLNATGTIEWQKTIGGNKPDNLRCVQQTNDGGYIVCGESLSDISGDKTEIRRDPPIVTNLFESDYWVLKLNNIGQIEWQKTLGGYSRDIPWCIKQTLDGGYIISGRSNSDISYEKLENSRGDYDFWIIKINSIGSIEWQKTLGGNSIEEFPSLIQTIDSGFVIAGTSSSGISGDKTDISRGNFDYWIIKLNVNGGIEWQKTIGGSQIDKFSSISLANNNHFIISGDSTSDISGEKNEDSRGFSDIWLLELDDLGNIVWQKTIGGSDYDSYSSVVQTEDNGYIFTCDSKSNISGEKTSNSRGLQDYWVVKLSPNNLETINLKNLVFSIFPNPTKDIIHINLKNNQSEITIEQISFFGKLIKSQNFYDQSKIEFEIVGNTGVYFLKIICDNKTEIEKIIKI